METRRINGFASVSAKNVNEKLKRKKGAKRLRKKIR